MGKLNMKAAISRLLAVALAAGALSGVLPGASFRAEAAESKYLPEADTYVSSVPAERDKNLNDAPYNQLHLTTNGENDIRYPYFRFNLAPLPANLEGAAFKLRLYTDASANGVTANVYAVEDDAWSETGITWNNKAPYGSKIATVSLPASAAAYTVDVDITDYIKQEKAKDGKASLAVVSNSGYWRNFINRERTWQPERQSYLVYIRDQEAPVYQSASVSPDFREISLQFDEAILDHTSGSLKSRVLLAREGAAYMPLGANDTVSIGDTVTSNVYLKIGLNSPLIGENNRIKVLANTVKDSYNNVTTTEITTGPLIGQADLSAPHYLSASVGGTAKTVSLNFDKLIAWNTAAPKDGFRISADGGATYQTLGANDTVTISGTAATIQFGSVLIGDGYKVKLLAHTVKSLASNLPATAEVETGLLAVPVPLAAPVTVKAAADTYVDAGGAISTSDVSANSPFYKNYGSEQLMYVREAPGASEIGAAKARSFLKFNIAELGAFNTAKLKLYLGYGGAQAGSAGIYAVEDDSWTEGGITYANQPAYGELLATVAIEANRTDTWYQWDVTEYLSKQKAKDGIASFMIMNDTASTAGPRSFRTKENSVGTIYPQLAVEYDSKAPAVTGVSVADNKKVELTFDETLVNKAADIKAAVQVAWDNGNFAALSAGDTVSISDKKLVIQFAQRLASPLLTVRVAPDTLADSFGNTNPSAILSQPIMLDVLAPVLNAAVSLDPANKIITIHANEALISGVADAAALKAAVSLSRNNQAYEPLAAGDTVAISGKALVVALASKLAGAHYQLKIAGAALKDASGNTVPEYISDVFSEDTAVPQLKDVYTVNFNKTVKLAFDEPIFNNLTDLQALKNALLLSTDGGAAYHPLAAGDKLEIGIRHLNIQLSQPVTGTGNKVKVAAGALKDAVGLTTAAAEGAFSARATDYPYAEPSEKYLADALNHIRNIAFANKNNAEGSAVETENAKGFSVVAQAIAAGNDDPLLVDEYVDALKKILSVPAKMPNLQAGLDDRSQSPIVYGIALLWNDARITSRLTGDEKSKLAVFMKAALIAEMYMLSDYDKDGNYIGHTVRRLAMNGDANNGVTGNFGEPHLTNLFAAAFAIGLENIKDIITGYDHKAFIAELTGKGLTTVAASFSNTSNFSTAATEAARLNEKAARVEAVLKSAKWSFMNVTLDEFLENPVKIHAAQEAFNWPYPADDGEFQGQTGMGLEFRSADQGGPRESPSYVILGLEPAISNTVLLNRFGYLHTPENAALAGQIEQVQKVASNDLYTKLVNGYFGQSWISTHTYVLEEADSWPFLMELLHSTGNITAATFNDTFNYAGVSAMAAGHWTVDASQAAIINDSIIPYNTKSVVNSSVVGGHNHDDKEKLLALTGGQAPAIAYNTAKKLANINYYAWISSPALGDGEAGILARAADADNYYQISYTRDKLFIKKKVNGSFTTLAEKAYTLPASRPGAVFYFNPWGWKDTIVPATAHRLRAELTNDTINVYVNGSKELTARDATFGEGYIGLTAAQTSARFDGLLVAYTQPAAPVLNSVKVGNGSLTLEFTPIDGVLNYKVKYGTAPGVYTHAVTTTSTAPVIPNLANDTAYYFVVSAVSAQGESRDSNEKAGTPKVPDAVTPVLNSLSPDGNEITVEFSTDPKNTSYIIRYGMESGIYTTEIQNVTASGYKVALPQLSALPYYFTVVPCNENGMGAASNELSVVQDTPFLPVAEVTASATPEAAYTPQNTIDGNLAAASRWSADKEQWIRYNLGAVKEIDAVSIAYSSGHLRKQYFDIEVSLDGQSWTNVYANGASSGTTQELETYPFAAVNAQYVRILCHGNSLSGYGLGYTSIIELRIFETAPSKPTGLQVQSKTASSVSLKWNLSTNQSGTAIAYDLYQGAVKANAADIAAAAYTVTGLQPDTSYTFTVVAKDSAGRNSAPGRALTVKTSGSAVPPAQPAEPAPTGSGAGAAAPSAPAAGTVQLTPVRSGTSAHSRVDAETVRKALEQAPADERGAKRVTLAIQPVPDVKEYVQELPKEAFRSAAPGDRAAEKKLIIETPLGAVALPDHMFKAGDIEKASKVELVIAAADISQLEAGLQGRIGGKPVIQLKALLDGKPIAWKNSNAPVAVSVDYKPAAGELEHSEHIAVWHIGDGGTVSRIPGKYDAATGKVTFSTTQLGMYAVAYEPKSFRDIANLAWAREQIEVLFSKGIVQGTSEAAFSPDAPITRADFIQLLVGALEVSAEFSAGFADVRPADYYYEAAGIARELGISQGVGDNRLNPGEYISRQDMMVLVERAMQAAGKDLGGARPGKLADFADASRVAAYARDSLSVLLRNGLIEGDGKSLNPEGNTTRAEAAVLLYRVYNRK